MGFFFNRNESLVQNDEFGMAYGIHGLMNSSCSRPFFFGMSIMLFLKGTVSI